uniref:Uncharacterized protein n=1 Tax=Anguilla anguilla TaxID=7936 RepID=A0A0E9W0R0_ANGAN
MEPATFRILTHYTTLPPQIYYTISFLVSHKMSW